MRLRTLSFLLVTMSMSPGANAISNNTWEDISNYSVFALVGTSLFLPVAKDDWEGMGQAAYSLATAEAIVQFGKAVVSEERPDHSDNKSFPSGHTAVAFASATTLYRRYGWETGVPALALATLTGTARVAARKHHWYDAVAGAVIGSSSAWLFTDEFNDKVQLVPWADSKSVGVSFAYQW